MIPPPTTTTATTAATGAALGRAITGAASPHLPPAPRGAASSAGASRSAAAGTVEGGPLVAPTSAPAAGAAPLDIARAAAAAALALGALGVVAVALHRVRRFRRLLATAVAAPPAVAARAGEIASQLGLPGAPPVRLVPAPVPPMLWPTRGGPLLLLPQQLLGRLTADERDALLAHELAHVRRRDHWVRFVEIAATALFWWYPVAWWARAALRRAEERCCDEWVLRVLPAGAGAYASGLLKSLAFVSGRGRPSPHRRLGRRSRARPRSPTEGDPDGPSPAASRCPRSTRPRRRRVGRARRVPDARTVAPGGRPRDHWTAPRRSRPSPPRPRPTLRRRSSPARPARVPWPRGTSGRL